MTDVKNYECAVLHWEMKTTVPTSSVEFIINAIKNVEKELFSRDMNNEILYALEGVIGSCCYDGLTYNEKYCIQKAYNNLKRLMNVPDEIISQYSEAKLIAQNVWLEAKKKNDYLLFKPKLEKLINLTKQYYSYIRTNNQCLYDEMLGSYEPGTTMQLLDSLFDRIKNGLKATIEGLPKQDDKINIKQYGRNVLIEISRYLLNYIGFDNDRSVLGFYPHGTTMGLNRNDVRIAFDDSRSIYDHVCTVIHEGGHGIFEQNIGDDAERFSVLDINGIGTLVQNMALHESQSRFFENMLGRDINFWTPIYDDVRTILGLNESIDEFVGHLNYAHPSLIRTEADDLTYCMHIILRYELEKAIFNDDVDLDLLPKMWNDKMIEYLGIKVDSDAHGILQDVHWSIGSFGYFPSYLLGSMFGAMLLECINDKLGNIGTILKNGDIKRITKFLMDNIHKNGGCYSIYELSNTICGHNLSAESLIGYLTNKYGK